MSVEGTAKQVRVWFDVPSSLPGLGQGRGVRQDLREAASVLRPNHWRRLAVGFPRRGSCESSKRGELTGPNPTDRGKLGVKRHVLTDGNGVPLSVEITGANVHDKWMVADVLDKIRLQGSRGPRRPINLCLDKGYDYRDVRDALRQRRITAHIRCRGEEHRRCRRGQRARRWVVERTNSWHNRFRAILVRWEHYAANHLALLELASGIIAFQQAIGSF